MTPSWNQALVLSVNVLELILAKILQANPQTCQRIQLQVDLTGAVCENWLYIATVDKIFFIPYFAAVGL